jgi:hypothetical protein
VREATGLSVVARCRRGKLQLRSDGYPRDIVLVDVECEIDRLGLPADQLRNALMQWFVREIADLVLEAQAMRTYLSASESDPTRTGPLDDQQQMDFAAKLESLVHLPPTDSVHSRPPTA